MSQKIPEAFVFTRDLTQAIVMLLKARPWEEVSSVMAAIDQSMPLSKEDLTTIVAMLAPKKKDEEVRGSDKG